MGPAQAGSDSAESVVRRRSGGSLSTPSDMAASPRSAVAEGDHQRLVAGAIVTPAGRTMVAGARRAARRRATM
jgi:hypothetical protein